jgi:serine/threonine protein kinase
MQGRTVGHYRLESEIGRGGFGAVYRGVHVHLEDIQVAVKVFHPELSRDDEFVRLLRRECQVLHSLSHTGIVAFRDLVVEDDVTAIVLELLVGQDLTKLVRSRGPLEVHEVVRITRGILEPLAHGHAAGIVHRDIKPANIFLCRDGTIKLMDFGIAKVTHTAHATQSGMVAGTLDYMSSERFDGHSPPCADVYATGLVAWWLLAGRKACPAGDIPKKIGWHLRQGAPDIRTERPETPPWFAEFILQLTAVEAKDRPADGRAALDLLDAVRTGTHPSTMAPLEPLDAPRPPAPAMVSKPESPAQDEPWTEGEPLPLAETAPRAVEVAAQAPKAPQPPAAAPPAERRRVEPQPVPTPARARPKAMPVPSTPHPVPRPGPAARPQPPRHRNAGAGSAQAYTERSAGRFPWATLVVVLVALAAGGFILSVLLRGG